MSVATEPDKEPRLLFLHQNPKCFHKKKSVAERKVVSIHVQKHQHRRKRAAAIQRLQNGRWNFFLPKPLKDSQEAKAIASALVEDVNPEGSPEGSPQGRLAREHWKAFSRTRGRSHDVSIQPATLAQWQGDHGPKTEYSNMLAEERSNTRSPEGSIELIHRRGSIASQLDTAEIDPFATSAMPISRTMNLILSHYVKTMIPLVYPIKLQATSANQEILQMALANPIVLNSMLAVSSVQKQSPGEEGMPTSVHAQQPFYLTHKIKAIQMINSAMSNAEEAGRASTIFAINNMMTIETMIGNHEEVQIHIGGIERILTMRGGFQNLPMFTVELLLPALYMSSVWTGTRPLFPPPAYPSSLSAATKNLILSDLPTTLTQIFSGFMSTTAIRFFSQTMISTIRSLETFTLFREHFRNHSSQRFLHLSELQYITIKGLHVEYQLLALPFAELQQHPIQEAVRNSLLMFKNGLYGIHSPTATIYRALVARLKAALDAFGPDIWSPTNQPKDLLFWTLCMGAHHSAGERERPWFVMQLARGARLLGLLSWEDLRNLLSKFAYLDRIYADPMRKVWEEVRLLLRSWSGR